MLTFLKTLFKKIYKTKVTFNPFAWQISCELFISLVLWNFDETGGYFSIIRESPFWEDD